MVVTDKYGYEISEYWILLNLLNTNKDFPHMTSVLGMSWNDNWLVKAHAHYLNTSANVVSRVLSIIFVIKRIYPCKFIYMLIEFLISFPSIGYALTYKFEDMFDELLWLYIET